MEKKPSKNNLVALLIFILFSCNSNSPKPDLSFDVSVPKPHLSSSKGTITFDEGHNEHHQIGNTYRPLGKLLSNDGFLVKANRDSIDETVLSGINIYCIVTPKGKVDPGDDSPFSQNEVASLYNWVLSGGSLLLVTEHYPFGLSMNPLLNRFGIEVHNGYTEDTLLMADDVKDALLFEKAKGNLNNAHPICYGVEKVYTFTGTAVKGDSSFVPLLIFSGAARNYNVKVNVTQNGGDVITNVEYADSYAAEGYYQAICRQMGKGRLVVLAESAMLTAQIDRNGNKFGMNVTNADNKQFALNLFRWLYPG